MQGEGRRRGGKSRQVKTGNQPLTVLNENESSQEENGNGHSAYHDHQYDQNPAQEMKKQRKAMKKEQFHFGNDHLFDYAAGWILTAVVIVGMTLMTYHVMWRLPRALPNDAPNDVFSEGRSWKHLVDMQDIGPSLVGTKSNVYIAEYIQSQLNIISSLSKEKRRNGDHTAPLMEIEIQRPSGALNFDLIGSILTNHYSFLHNVVVRISWPENWNGIEEPSKADLEKIDSQKALLVNSHFDSGLSSPGTTDARACISVMIELVRSVALGGSSLRHPVIFLFNGAEESLQEGSHGFITKHRWRTQIGSVLNLDAGGVGGPEILFQVGSGEYAALYAQSAPRFHGSIMAEELFETGLLQGDTDYRIFRDFGNIHGLDLAFYKDGYKYHTPRDDIAFIDEGSLQHAGDNTLAYIKAICQSDLLEQKPSRKQLIFYDFLSLFVVVYPIPLAHMLHLIVIATIVYCLHTSIGLKRAIFSGLSILTSNLAGLILSILLAAFLTFTGMVMKWFTYQRVIAYLYIPPIMIAWNLLCWRRKKLVQAQQPHQPVWQLLEYERFHGVVAFYAASLLLWTVMGIYSAYVVFWLAGAGLAGLVVIRLFGDSHKSALLKKDSMIPWFAYLCFLPALVVSMQISTSVMAMAFPLAGRLPPDVLVEIVIGALFSLFALNILTPATPLIHRFRRYKLSLQIWTVLLVLALIVAYITFPYSPTRPKRITMQHSSRTSPHPEHHALDNPQILFALCDAGPVGSMVTNLNHFDSRGATPHRNEHDWDAVWPFSAFLYGFALPAPPIIMLPPTAVLLNDSWNNETQERKVTIQVDYAGYEWSTMKFMGPLKGWNLTDIIPPTTPEGFHVIRHIGQHKLTTWAVDLVFGDQKPRRIDITATHFVSTAFAKQVLIMLPDWVAPLSFTTVMSHINI